MRQLSIHRLIALILLGLWLPAVWYLCTLPEKRAEQLSTMSQGLLDYTASDVEEFREVFPFAGEEVEKARLELSAIAANPQLVISVVRRRWLLELSVVAVGLCGVAFLWLGVPFWPAALLLGATAYVAISGVLGAARLLWSSTSSTETISTAVKFLTRNPLSFFEQVVAPILVVLCVAFMLFVSRKNVGSKKNVSA